MKSVLLIACMLLFFHNGFSQTISGIQETVPVFSATHDPNYLKKHERVITGSFYQSKENWQAIIDSTWGPGSSYLLKLRIFDSYAGEINNRFDGFLSLGWDDTQWDSLRNHYRSMINDSTSRGRFCAIMNYFSNEFRDIHTIAGDTTLFSTAFNPGVPFLCAYGFWNVEHFGAVATALPDCTSLILRVVDDHPLGLKPGDIILGYEGIPYHILLNDLTEAQIPALLPFAGAKSAEQHFYYQNVGMNWHMFETIDILQYSSGDTLHLPTVPLINLDVPPMLNFEQLEIPGIPFPDWENNQIVSYGIIENTNIGYIYLISEDYYISPSPDDQFFEAVNALKNTEGLIIDMRWNEGGWAFFDDAFEILFNESFNTLNGANRCSNSSHDLCTNNYTESHQINGDPESLYDFPIALLLGPTCVSMGDRTATRLNYHPMLKSFGKAPAASFGLNRFIENYAGWFLRYSTEDLYHVNQPGVYLNRSEFPIDFPVWFDPADVANGEDTVVKTALEWIENLSYAHDVTVDKTYVKPITDTILITATPENPNQHELSLSADITTFENVFVDSLPLYDDGEHGDGYADDNLWGNFYYSEDEHSFNVSVTTHDRTLSSSHTISNAAWFTSIGRVAYDFWSPYIVEDSIPNPGDALGFKLHLKNEGGETTAKGLEARIYSDTPKIIVHNHWSTFPDISAGNTVESTMSFSVQISSDIFSDTTIYVSILISSNDYDFWIDSFPLDIVTSLDKSSGGVPATFGMDQNYPNPFNPTTIINYGIPITNDVELSIFNLLGQKIVTLVSEKKNAGYHQIEWDASGFANGIYYYQIKAGEFHDVKKMILLR
jgi:hypothetical protein